MKLQCQFLGQLKTGTPRYLNRDDAARFRLALPSVKRTRSRVAVPHARHVTQRYRNSVEEIVTAAPYCAEPAVTLYKLLIISECCSRTALHIYSRLVNVTAQFTFDVHTIYIKLSFHIQFDAFQPGGSKSTVKRPQECAPGKDR